MIAQLLVLAAEEFMPGPLTVGGAALLMLSAIGILWRQGVKQSEERITRLQKEADDREVIHRRESEERYTEMKSQRDEYKKITISDILDGERFAHRQMRERNIPLVPTLVPVAPQQNSPPTEAQRDAAEFATIKARAEALKLVRHLLVNGQEKLVDDSARLSEDAKRLSESVAKLSHDQIPAQEPSLELPERQLTSIPPLASGIVPGNLTAIGIIKGDEGATHPVEIKGKIDPPANPE